MGHMKLTKTSVEALPFKEQGQEIFWDTELPGFGVLVSRKTKTYVVQGDVRGRSVRTTIGRANIYSADSARARAKMYLQQMAEGINPNKEKKKAKLAKENLEAVYKDYLKARKGKLKKGTLVGYQDFMENHFSDWLKKDMRSIDRDSVIKRFEKITTESGKGAANGAMTFLRALFNYAAIDDETLINPLKILSQKKLWHKTGRRQDIIKPTQLKDWFDAVMKLQNDSFRDAVLMLLFTGLRKNEAFTLQWQHVDFKAKTFHVPDTKNKAPLTLPMNSFVYELLEGRKEHARSEKWVFDGTGKKGHIIDAASTIRFIKREAELEAFSLHTLRRTFITTAERLDISPYTIKALVNHKLGNDVTAGYVIRDVERLRVPSARIAELLKSQVGLNVSENEVDGNEVIRTEKIMTVSAKSKAMLVLKP